MVVILEIVEHTIHCLVLYLHTYRGKQQELLLALQQTNNCCWCHQFVGIGSAAPIAIKLLSAVAAPKHANISVLKELCMFLPMSELNHPHIIFLDPLQTNHAFFCPSSPFVKYVLGNIFSW